MERERSQRCRGLSPARTAVAVLNQDGERFLDACFQALAGQEAPGGRELVLVDNGSTDGSQDRLAAAFPEVRVIRLGANLGYAAGYNRAFEMLDHEYVVLLNNDTRVRPGWLQALVAAADADPDVAAVTAKLVFADRPNIIQSTGTLLLSDGGGGDRGFGEEDRGQYRDREEVFGFNGGSALLRRSALDDVGGFDQRFFSYYEDTDLSWRMRLRGWRIIYEPQAVVEHVHAGTSGEWSESFMFHVDRNRMLMMLKNGSLGFVASAFRKVGVRAAGGPGRERSPRSGRHYGRVLGSMVANFPAVLLNRARSRGRMTVSDAEIERWVYPREKWDAASG